MKELFDSIATQNAEIRTIALFYKNTESDKVKNVTIVNATMEQLQDFDNTIFADHISNELKQNFDRLDLRRNLSGGYN